MMLLRGLAAPVLKHPIGWVCLISALALLALPEAADAQPRRTPPRRPRPVPTVRVWAGPEPWFHPRLYPNPYSYGAWGPHLQPYDYHWNRGTVRLEVEPEETEVYVDGYYAGVVDSYDGFFQRLHLPPGEHDIELRLHGYRSLQRALYVPIGATFHIKHRMEPLNSGSEPPSPTQTFEGPQAKLLPSTLQRRSVGRPPLSVAGRGALTIRVQPTGATIFIDGENWQSPDGSRLELELSAGRHHIEVDRSGYEGHITDVEIRRDETTTVNISLPRTWPR